MEWKGMEIPCMIENSRGIRIASEFTLRAEFKANVIGGIQTIFSKRVPLSTGNRPGLLVTLRGSLIECMTFQEGGKKWITARTLRNMISVGQKYEILVFRVGAKMDIYVNGIKRTHPRHGQCCAGDVNCDVEIFLGGQLYDKPPLAEKFMGKIYTIELYDQAQVSGASALRYPHNPFAFPLNQLAQKKEELKLPITIERA